MKKIVTFDNEAFFRIEIGPFVIFGLGPTCIVGIEIGLCWIF